MPRTVGIGIQDFGKIIKQNCFYIDKTSFIKEWWNNHDDVTLITRPRRFGKTLTLSMVERFFSNQYDDQEKLFGDLAIWQDEEMRKLAGQFPVISLSFAAVKETVPESAKRRISQIISRAYSEHRELLQSEKLLESEKESILQCIQKIDIPDAANALGNLCDSLSRHNEGKKVIILLDEYDTPCRKPGLAASGMNWLVSPATCLMPHSRPILLSVVR